MDLFKLTAELIKIPSVSGAEQEVLDFLKNQHQGRQILSQFNLEEIEIYPGDPRKALFFKVGRPKILFSTHVDVVPAKPAQFEPRIEGDVIYGRGACDAKGILVSMIAACEQLAKLGSDHFGLLVVFEEETGGKPAKICGEYLKNHRLRYIINGEPTKNILASGQKGNCFFEIEVRGKSAHSALPELGVDANAALVKIISALEQTNFGRSADFGQATINVGLIEGGSAANVISDSARCQAMIRVVSDLQKVEEKLRKVVYGAQKIVPPENVILRTLSQNKPIKCTKIPDFKFAPVSYFSDLPHLMRSGASGVLYGPGDIKDAHTDQEKISLRELEQAVVDYQKIFHYL